MNLLTKLLDLDTQFEADLRETGIIRFGAKRARLAAEFLCQEIEPAANRAALGKKRPCRFGMGKKTVEFLPDIGFDREDQRLLMQTVLIEIRMSGKKRKGLGETGSDRLGRESG